MQKYGSTTGREVKIYATNLAEKPSPLAPIYSSEWRKPI
jgi:hypothetical protein